MATRPTRAIVLLFVLACVFVGGELPAAELPVGERLRQAWIAHRIAGDLERAEGGYRTLFEDESVVADVRARAAIGLALIAEKRGRIAEARSVLRRVRLLVGAAPRWQIVARRELFRIPDPDANRDPITELNREVKSLEREKTRLEERTGDADQALERRHRLYHGLREFVVERGSESADGDRAAMDLLESLTSELRETERYRRVVVASRLDRARRLHHQGQFVRALNEAKKVLKVDPSNSDAEEVKRKCQLALSDLTSSPESGLRPFERELLREMLRRYEEARENYSAGRITAAIRGLDELLSWYAFSAEPIADSIVTEMIRPAERLMRHCFEATNQPTVAARLNERSRALRRQLDQATERLEERGRAIDEAGEEVAVIRAVAPGESATFVATQVGHLRSIAETHDREGRHSAALAAYEDLLVWWSWFPELIPTTTQAHPDAATTVRKRIDALR